MSNFKPLQPGTVKKERKAAHPMETYTKPTVGNIRILKSLLCLKIDIFLQKKQNRITPLLQQPWYVPLNKINL